MKLMKKMLMLGLVSSIIGGTVIYAQPEKPVIILDAGHYLEETYKSSPDGYLEVTYNMEIVKLVKRNIERERPHIKVIESNPDGTNKGRGERANFALENNAKLLFSLHMNVIGGDKNEWQSEIDGSHIIVDNDANEDTINLAYSIVNDYIKSTGFKKHHGDGFEIRGDGQNQVTMLDVASKSDLPAMILEMNFMDNPEFATLFRSEEGKEMVAKAISDSLIKNFIDKLYYEEPEEEIDIDKLIDETINEVINEEELDNESEDNELNNELENNESEDNELNNESENNQSEDNELNNESENNESENNQSEDNELENNQSKDNESKDNKLENNELENNELEDNESKDNKLENNQSKDNESKNNELENNQSKDNKLENNQSKDNESKNNNLNNNIQSYENKIETFSKNINESNKSLEQIDIDNLHIDNKQNYDDILLEIEELSKLINDLNY